MGKSLKSLVHFLVPALIIWLESRLAFSRDWSTLAWSARFLPLFIPIISDLTSNRRSIDFSIVTLGSLGLMGFVFSMFSIPLALWVQSFCLYSAIAALILHFDHRTLSETKEFAKPFLHGFALLCSASLLVHISVSADLWSGFYIDFDVARTMSLCLLACPVFYFVHGKLHGTRHRRIFIEYVVGVSLVSSLSFVAWRMNNFGGFSVGTKIWVTFSILALHTITWWSFVKPLLSKIWQRKLVARLSSLAISSYALILATALFVIATHIEFAYTPRERPRGLFEKTARHLLHARLPAADSTAFDPQIRTLKVLSYNVWDVESWIPQFLVGPSRDLEIRLALIPDAIGRLNPDIVIFQEVWKNKRKFALIEKLKSYGYPYSVMGSDPVMAPFGVNNGLLIVSKFTLDPNLQIFTFSVNTRIDEGPLFARKGVIKTRANIGQGDKELWIDIYASHLGGFSTIAKNGRAVDFKEREQKAKAIQARELAQFIQITRSSNAMILGVDLNTHPHPFSKGAYDEQVLSKEYAMLVCGRKIATDEDNCLGLKDPAAEIYPDKHSKLYTYDTRQNYYARTGHFTHEPPGRIDYVLSSGDSLKALRYELVLTDYALSDHSGVLTTFAVQP